MVPELEVDPVEPVDSSTDPVDPDPNLLETEPVPDGQVTIDPLQSLTHPALVGKSPAEIDALFRLAEDTTREQRVQLDSIQRSAPAQPIVPVAPEPEDPNEFFANPQASIRTEAGRAVKQEMEEMFKPFRAEMEERQGETVRARLRIEIPEFTKYEAHMDFLLKQGNFPNPNDEGLLKMLHYTAKGYALSDEAANNGASTTVPEPRVPSPAPPQHRPSATPLPAAPAVKLAPLTENEKRMMTEFGMTEADYRAYGSAEVDEVLTMDRGGTDG